MIAIGYGLTSILIAAVAINASAASVPFVAKQQAKQAIRSAYKTQDQAQVRQDLSGYMSVYAPDVIEFIEYTPYRWHSDFATIRNSIRGQFNPSSLHLYEPDGLEKITWAASTRIANFSINQAGTQAKVFGIRHLKMSGYKSVTNVNQPEYLLYERKVDTTELDTWGKDVTGWHIVQQNLINCDDTSVAGYHTISSNFLKSFH